MPTSHAPRNKKDVDELETELYAAHLNLLQVVSRLLKMPDLVPVLYDKKYDATINALPEKVFALLPRHVQRAPCPLCGGCPSSDDEGYLRGGLEMHLAAKVGPFPCPVMLAARSVAWYLRRGVR
jgi:hypothetical protein